MKPLATAFAVAAALGASCALAATGDAWYGTNRDTGRPATSQPDFGPLPPETSERVTVYYDEPAPAAPVVVERAYDAPPPADVVVLEPIRDDDLFVVEPRTYSRIGHGLFPDKGPNDFGQ